MHSQPAPHTSPSDSRHLYFLLLFYLPRPRPPSSTLFPYTTLFRSERLEAIQPMLASFTPLTSAAAAEKPAAVAEARSEEHTSELQSHSDLVCRLLLEKK